MSCLRPPLRPRLQPLAAALALSTLVAAAHAAPEPTPEPPARHGLVQQVRDKASDMVIGAMNFLGVPYRRGGSSSDDGFDCSGFTRHVFESSLGLVLPRRVDDQAKAPGFVKVRRDDLQPGDLVFFNTLKRTFSHVGIYIGDGRFIHSPRSGGEVRIEDMRFAYWAKRFTGARRAGSVDAAAPMPAESAVAAPVAADAPAKPAMAAPAAHLDAHI